jgi:chromosome segregation ATPase
MSRDGPCGYIPPPTGHDHEGNDPMSADASGEGLRDRLTRQGEDALGKLAQDLLENPIITGAISRAFEAREKAAAAQEAAMGALNIPSAGDVERLTRRLRSVSQRLEGIEDAIDRVDERLAGGGRAAAEERLEAIAKGLETRLKAIEKEVKAPRTAPLEDRLKSVEQQLAALASEVAKLRDAIPPGAEPLPREQERLQVGGA